MNAPVTDQLFDAELTGTVKLDPPMQVDSSVMDHINKLLASFKDPTVEFHHVITDNLRWNMAKGTYRSPKQRDAHWLQVQSLGGQKYDMEKITGRILADEKKKHEKVQKSRSYHKDVVNQINEDNVRRFASVELAKEWIKKGAIKHVPEETINFMLAAGMSVQVPDREAA